MTDEPVCQACPVPLIRPSGTFSPRGEGSNRIEMPPHPPFGHLLPGGRARPPPSGDRVEPHLSLGPGFLPLLVLHDQEHRAAIGPLAGTFTADEEIGRAERLRNIFAEEPQ